MSYLLGERAEAVATGVNDSMYQTLQYREDGAVATIRLNRPQKKNSFNGEMRHELEQALQTIARKTTIRAVVITGSDDIFCAGADISEMGGAPSAEASYCHAREFQDLFDQVESLPQPVIAAVSGFALGGGCELALAADFRIVSETARFGLPEIKTFATPASSILASMVSKVSKCGRPPMAFSMRQISSPFFASFQRWMNSGVAT